MGIFFLFASSSLFAVALLQRDTQTHPPTSIPPPKKSRFAKGGDRAVFERFWTTNSVPTVTEQLPEDDAFTVLDLMDKIVYDLDFH